MSFLTLGVDSSILLLYVSKSTSTHHFRVLRQAGVIAQEVFGTSKLTSLRREDRDERFTGLLDAVLGSAAVPR